MLPGFNTLQLSEEVKRFLLRLDETPENLTGRMQEYTSIIHISSINVARRPVYVRLALWFLHHPAWIGEPHGWVPVDTHSTPVLTSVRRLWVAYAVQEPNTPQEHAQPVHGSGARVQDHDPEPASQFSTVEPLTQVMVAAEQTQRQ